MTQPTQYSIRAVDPRAHHFETRCTVSNPDPAGQRFRLPVWIPGSYLVREFARHFVDVRAQCNGSDIGIVKQSKDSWLAAPCDGPVSVVAKIYAFDLSVRTAYLDTTRGYFNGASVFLCPVGREDAPCVVHIEAPDDEACRDWRVATTLTAVDAAPYGFGRYAASDYAELIDHPVEMSAFALQSFVAGDAQHDIAISGRQSGDLARLTSDLARVCQWHIDLFEGTTGGCAPFQRYLFQITVVGEGYGGLEHRSSTSLVCRRDELPPP
ncbi:MAG TPA: peptidase M61, partial [Casimicrobiaceae bacterium]|nr:peptidase M61 [Casimicrobiaceae bacterium]